MLNKNSAEEDNQQKIIERQEQGKEVGKVLGTSDNRLYPVDINFDIEIIQKGTIYHLRPLKQEHGNELIELISDVYPDEEPMSILTNLTKEDLKFFAEARVIQAVKSKLGVIAITSENQIAAVITAQDASEQLDPDEYAMERSESYKEKMSLFLIPYNGMKFIQENPSSFETPLYENISIGTIVVHKDHRGRGLCSALVKFMFNDHPLTRKTKRFSVTAGNNISMKTFEKHGCKLIREVQYSELKLNGKSIFEDFDNKMMSHPGLKNNTTMGYYCYDH